MNTHNTKDDFDDIRQMFNARNQEIKEEKQKKFQEIDAGVQYAIEQGIGNIPKAMPINPQKSIKNRPISQKQTKYIYPEDYSSYTQEFVDKLPNKPPHVSFEEQRRKIGNILSETITGGSLISTTYLGLGSIALGSLPLASGAVLAAGSTALSIKLSEAIKNYRAEKSSQKITANSIRQKGAKQIIELLELTQNGAYKLTQNDHLKLYILCSNFNTAQFPIFNDTLCELGFKDAYDYLNYLVDIKKLKAIPGQNIYDTYISQYREKLKQYINYILQPDNKNIDPVLWNLVKELKLLQKFAPGISDEEIKRIGKGRH